MCWSVFLTWHWRWWCAMCWSVCWCNADVGGVPGVDMFADVTLMVVCPMLIYLLTERLCWWCARCWSVRCRYAHSPWTGSCHKTDYSCPSLWFSPASPSSSWWASPCPKYPTSLSWWVEFRPVKYICLSLAVCLLACLSAWPALSACQPACFSVRLLACRSVTLIFPPSVTLMSVSVGRCTWSSCLPVCLSVSVCRSYIFSACRSLGNAEWCFNVSLTVLVGCACSLPPSINSVPAF